MAYAIIHHFPGGTQENYEASLAAVHPGPGQLPQGQIFHAAGPAPGGWTIIAVHESKASWEQFRDGVLMPRLQAGVDGGFATPAEETAIDLYKVMPWLQSSVARSAIMAARTTTSSSTGRGAYRPRCSQSMET
jgi:hypothetical protein